MTRRTDEPHAAQVSAHSGDEEIRLEVLVEYTATADDVNGGPVRGRHLSLPVQLIVQPAIRVRAVGLLGMRLRGGGSWQVLAAGSKSEVVLFDACDARGFLRGCLPECGADCRASGAVH